MRILLDTDIGDDIDDALALGLICRCPEVELAGVTTVFGNVAARGRQVQTILQVAGGAMAKMPVAAGCGETMASRKHAVVQGDVTAVPGQAGVSWAVEKLPALDRRHGAEMMVDILMGGDVVPVLIGAMTNMVAALQREPRLAGRIPRVVVMAAEFEREMVEWNIQCDPEAAAVVFSSGIAMEVVPFTLGRVTHLTGAEVRRIGESERPLARHLGETIGVWRGAWKLPQAVPCMYDPIAVAALVRPELFEWRRGRVEVELAGERYGRTGFVEGAGRHRVAFGVDREKAVGWFMERVAG